MITVIFAGESGRIFIHGLACFADEKEQEAIMVRLGVGANIEARIYVGLRDKDSHEQHFDIQKYKSVLKSVCKNYRAPFSLQVIEGGYYHQDGTYVEENTLLITLMGLPSERVYTIAQELCNLFNQETVMVTCAPVLHFIHRNEPIIEEGFEREGEGFNE